MPQSASEIPNFRKKKCNLDGSIIPTFRLHDHLSGWWRGWSNRENFYSTLQYAPHPPSFLSLLSIHLPFLASSHNFISPLRFPGYGMTRFTVTEGWVLGRICHRWITLRIYCFAALNLNRLLHLNENTFPFLKKEMTSYLLQKSFWKRLA